MSIETVKDVYKDGAKDVAVHICTVAADLSLCAVWLIGEYCLEHFLVPKFPVDTPIVRIALWIFRTLFAISTLVPCASKIRKHVMIIWMRDEAAIRKVKIEIGANDPNVNQAMKSNVNQSVEISGNGKEKVVDACGQDQSTSIDQEVISTTSGKHNRKAAVGGRENR